METYEKMLDEIYEKMPKKVLMKERFEPPNFESSIEGKQTIISNFKEVADTLRREPLHLLKYISKEMATSGDISGRRVLLKGKFTRDQLNSRLKNYIEEYILCKECNKPDTSIITFQGSKYKQCEVCGAKSPVRAI